MMEKASTSSEKRRGKQKQIINNSQQCRPDGSSEVSETSCISGASSNMRGTTRYTISSKESLPTNEIPLGERSQSPIQIPPPAIVMRAPRSHKATVDLSSHTGQAAKINLPQIGEDLTSRLEGLKLYKNWSERIREEAQHHNQGIPHVVSQSPQVSASTAVGFTAKTISTTSSSSSAVSTAHPTFQKQLPIRQRSDSIDTRLDAAPTPFSSPAVFPVSNATPAPVSGTSRSPLIYSASPPGLNLSDTAVPQHAPIPTRKRSIVISSTPAKDLLKQSRSRSSSRSNVPIVSKPQTRDHRYPPVSFPKSFNEQEYQHVSGTGELPGPTTRRPTPSISPMTKPKSDADTFGQPQPPATPHDKRGRPTFYSTIHYYTECPHASPPATRPLDPDFQPRKDPDFHPTNPAISRSIIPGSCFNCDTMHRRAQENVVIDDFMAAITLFKDKLALRLDQLDQLAHLDDESSDAEFEAYNEDVDRLRASCTFPEDAHDLRHQLSSMSLPPLHDEQVSAPERKEMTPDERSSQARLVKEIRQIETAIDRLRAEQDSNVRAVWAGYTRRWGPATRGVQRGNWASDLERYETKDDHDAMLEYTRRSIEQRLAMPDEIDHLDLEDSGSTHRDELQVVEVDEDQEGDDIPTRRSTSRQRTTSSNTLRRSQRSVSRSSSQRKHNPSIRDSPAGLNPGEGKMQISWHR